MLREPTLQEIQTVMFRPECNNPDHADKPICSMLVHSSCDENNVWVRSTYGFANGHKVWRTRLSNYVYVYRYKEHCIVTDTVDLKHNTFDELFNWYKSIINVPAVPK